MKTQDHVQAHTDEGVNREIESEARDRVLHSGGEPPRVLAERIQQLDNTWDIERWLEMNASALAFTGVVLGCLGHRKWLALPALVLPFLFLHAVQGWCPPIPLLRRLGVRTRREIDEEKFALKALRGDFAKIDPDAQGPRVRALDAWRAATS